MLRMRIEEHGPLAAFRWRGGPGAHAVPACLWRVAEKAELAPGSPCSRGRKVVEARPPVPIEKRQSVRELMGAGRPHGVGSEAGPGNIVMPAGLLAVGAVGFARVSEGLLRAAR